MNWAWWDGKVTKHWQQEEHPLEEPPAGSAATGLDNGKAGVEEEQVGEGI